MAHVTFVHYDVGFVRIYTIIFNFPLIMFFFVPICDIIPVRDCMG